MADRIVKSDISVKDPAGDYIKSLEQANKITKQFEKSQLSLLETNKKVIKQYQVPTNIKEVKALSTAVSEQKKGVDSLNTTRKAQLQIDKELKQARAQEIRQAKQQAKEVKEVEKAVAKFNKEQKKAKKLSDDNANAFKRLTKKTNEAQAEFKRLAAQYGVTSTQARKAELTFRKLDDRLRKINNTARDGRRDVGRYGLALQKVRGTLSTGLGALGITAGIAGLARIVGSTIGIFTEFEQANSNLQAILGATDSDMTLLKNSAKELGATTAFTAAEVTSLQTEFAKLGFDSAAIENATGATLALAAAAGTDLAEAASVAGATLGGFGLGAEETARVTDVMAKSFSTSALDMEKFKESMKSAAPAANAIGISVEKTTALLGTLANAGISGSKAGNNLKASFINLNAAGLTLKQGLDKVAKSNDKLGTATKLVGKNAAASFLVLAEGVDTTKKLEEGLNDAAGAAQEMADIQLDNLAGSVTILNSAWEGFVLSLEDGEGKFSNLLRTIIDVATELLSMATGTAKATEELDEAGKRIRDIADKVVFLGKAIAIVVTAFIAYKVTLKAINLATKLYTATTNALRIAQVKLKGGLKGATKAMKGFNTASKANIIGALVALLALAVTAYHAFRDAANEAADAERDRQLAVAEGEAQQKSIEDRIKILTELNKAQLVTLLNSISARKEALKIDENITENLLRQAELRKILDEGTAGTSIDPSTGEEIDLTPFLEEELRLNIESTDALNEKTDALERQRIIVQERLDFINKQIELDKELTNGTGEESKAITDLIEKQKELLKWARLLDGSSEENIATRNKIIESINQEIVRLQALGKEKERQSEITKIALLEEEEDGQKEFEAENKRRADILEAEAQLERDLDAINDAKFNSAKNLTELLSGLAKEGTREAELLIRLKKTLAITEIAIDLQAEIAAIRKNNAGKDNQTEINTAQIFEATTVAALGVAGVISAFEGMDDTGTVAQPLDSNGGRLMNIHNNEQIWSKKNVKDGGGRTRDESIGILQSFDQGLLMSPHAFKSLEMGNIVNSSDVNLKGFENAVNAQTAQLDSSMKKNAVHVEVGFNNIGEFFKKMKKEGTTRITTAKGDGGFL